MGVPMGISVRHNSKLAAAVALAAAVLAVVWFARALQTEVARRLGVVPGRHRGRRAPAAGGA